MQNSDICNDVAGVHSRLMLLTMLYKAAISPAAATRTSRLCPLAGQAQYAGQERADHCTFHAIQVCMLSIMVVLDICLCGMNKLALAIHLLRQLDNTDLP